MTKRPPPDKELLFTVDTPLATTIRTTRTYWTYLVNIKHPVMRGKAKLVQRTLQHPNEIRQSKTDPDVHLYYQKEPGTPYHICVVVKHLNGEGFIITTYRTDRIKEGDRTWTP